MTTTLVINTLLAGLMFVTILGLIGWAMRTQTRDEIGLVVDLRRRVDRRSRAAHPRPAQAERREAERRYGRDPATA